MTYTAAAAAMMMMVTATDDDNYDCSSKDDDLHSLDNCGGGLSNLSPHISLEVFNIRQCHS
jgi:hypothetical protein